MDRHQRSLRRLRWAARAITLLGIAASILGNALHADSNGVALGISMSPPVILFLAFELVSRIPLPNDVSWYARWLRPGATGIIAGIAAWLSYWHQHSMIMKYTSDYQSAALLPLAIDGLLVVAAISLLELNARLRNLESIQMGQGLRLVPSAGPTPQLRNFGELSKKERIVVLAEDQPDLSIRQIAEQAGASYNYAHALVSQLRQPQTQVA